MNQEQQQQQAPTTSSTTTSTELKLERLYFCHPKRVNQVRFAQVRLLCEDRQCQWETPHHDFFPRIHGNKTCTNKYTLFINCSIEVLLFYK